MSFPSSIPSYAGFTSSHTLQADNHAAQHNQEQSDISAIATKIGTGASTPTNNTVLRGNGTGTSVWGQVGLTTDVTGVLPTNNGGTGSSTITGSGLPVFQTSPTITSPTESGGTYNTATINAPTTNAIINTGGFTTDNFTATGTVTLPSKSINQTALPLGVVVQIVTTNYSAVAAGTTVMPIDDTIPQITEGDEYMTQAITPKSTTNLLVVEVVFVGTNSGSTTVGLALFQDSTANALAATEFFVGTGEAVTTWPLTYSMTAGTTSATTFHVRAGAPVGTVGFNGVATGTRRFGGAIQSMIKITEYKA